MSMREEPPEPWDVQHGGTPRELLGIGAGERGQGISQMLHPLGKALEVSIASTQKEPENVQPQLGKRDGKRRGCRVLG